jgi:hypothetical protein
MEVEFFSRAVSRIYRFLLLLAVCGGLYAWRLWGWQGMVGFLLGAGFALLNFRWLHQLVDSVVAENAGRPRRRLVFFLCVRYILFGAGAYAIMKLLEISLLAPLAGMLMAAAAVVIEILYELILYART